MSSSRKGVLKAEVYKGAPDVNVELPTDGGIEVQVKLNERLAEQIKKATGDTPISISLESLDVDLQHNQSYGMVAASTGCISNPGGPSC